MQTTIPESMQAVVVEAQNQTITVRQIPVQKPGPGQVLIRMAAAPINPSDLGFARGSYGPQRVPYLIPGFEGSGVVVAAGSGLLPRLLLGRHVTCSTPSGGTWAEYLAVPARNCFPLRKSLSLEEGSMLIVNPLTAVAFFEIAKQGRHRAIINNAAAGALGQMILRLGQARHIPVIHIVRRDEHVELLRSMGAEHVLNSSDAVFTDKLQQVSHQLGATLILDPVGGEQTLRLLDAAPDSATAILYGSLAGNKKDIHLLNTSLSAKRVEGFFMPDWLATKNIWQVLGYLTQVQRLAKKELRTKIQQRFLLAQVEDALALYQTNPSAGKILFVSN
jgi:NADPH:quinone reductase-like Zn-dependent oxidoreductase